ncbi:hypothetical protein FB567DRAFT_453389 [Paraphoma chrysanthemicola]|uniref:Gfd2/YDR514C-like C-terminal domain-containing protein n=1 Tax=Paraphoma chrysanthemicola TaxID=798071 RepID=A0A8K0QV16_9PLEO|nr:hypothetical protein FB567DRAFT_453389 [Paraphoma chrysanthemicola]
MATSTTAKLQNMRDKLSVKPHREILQSYLHQNKDLLLREAVLVTLYRKWSARPLYGLVEIGIATYDRLRVNCGAPCPPGPHAEDLLRQIWSIHLRIRSHAHLPVADASSDAFHFGTSVFVSHEEAQDLLHQVFHQLIDETRPDQGYRPIICLTFGNNDGLAKVRHADFNFMPMNINTTIAVLDAQNIAIQARITSKVDAPIEYILPIFMIKPLHVGNAGNAATYITIIAFLSILRDQIYGAETNPRAKPGQKGISASKPADSVMQWLMERPTPAPPFGVTTYCCRCSSLVHMAEECPNTDLVCSKCMDSMANWRQENATTHRDGMCVFR